MVRSGQTCVLVDPLLCEELGDVHALTYRVYPPRILRAELLPPVDAVILSHEHDDHFDIPSLARLDRRIPIFMSVHSSIAAFEILRRMGFVAQALVPGVPIDVGGLQIMDGETEVLEYSASACAFVPGVAVDTRNVYLAGWECWATDLLAVLRGELGPIALMFGRARLWNALPQRFRFDFLEGLTRVSHPLRRPAEYLRMYERQWEKNKAIAPTIRAAVANAGAVSLTVM